MTDSDSSNDDFSRLSVVGLMAAGTAGLAVTTASRLLWNKTPSLGRSVEETPIVDGFRVTPSQDEDEDEALLKQNTARLPITVFNRRERDAKIKSCIKGFNILKDAGLLTCTNYDVFIKQVEVQILAKELEILQSAHLLNQDNYDALIAVLRDGAHHLGSFFDGLEILQNANLLNQDNYDLLIRNAANARSLAHGLRILQGANLLTPDNLGTLIENAANAQSLAHGLRILQGANLLTPYSLGALIDNAAYATSLAQELERSPQDVNLLNADNRVVRKAGAALELDGDRRFVIVPRENPAADYTDFSPNVMALIDSMPEAQKANLEAFLLKMLEEPVFGGVSPERQAAIRSYLEFYLEPLVHFLISLEKSGESYQGEKALAWQEVADGSTSCADRALLCWQRLNNMRMVHNAEDLQAAKKVIIGNFRSEFIKTLVAKDFFDYDENLEVALWAQRELHDKLQLPGNKPPQQMYLRQIGIALSRKSTSIETYLSSVAELAIAASNTAEQCLEILLASPAWAALIRSKRLGAFDSARKKAEDQMTALEEASSIKDGEYVQKAAAAKDLHEGKSLVEQFTRKYLELESASAQKT